MSDEDKPEVAIFPGVGRRDPVAMLEAAKSADLGEVMIVGWRKDGRLFMSGSPAKMNEVHWLLSCGIDEVWRMMNGQSGS